MQFILRIIASVILITGVINACLSGFELTEENGHKYPCKALELLHEVSMRMCMLGFVSVFIYAIVLIFMSIWGI